MSKATLTVRIGAETRDALDAIAANLDRDRSYVVNEALEDYIELHRWQIEHIRQGLREADAGKFMSPSQMKTLTKRLRSK
jgi:predicted transcriptional regulator